MSNLMHAPMTRDQQIDGLARGVAARASNSERADAIARIRKHHGEAVAAAARLLAWQLVKQGYKPRRVETPAARATDPAPSHAAAEQVTVSGVRAVNRHIVARAVRSHPGFTSRELTAYCSLGRYEIARRLPDAATAGEVVRGQPRICDLGGKAATTWWPV